MSKQVKYLPEETLSEEPLTISPPDDELDEQPLVAKKKESTLPSSSVSPAPSKPSEKSSEESTPTDNSFLGTLKQAAQQIVKAYKTPKDKESKEPISPIENAFKRGSKTASKANVLGLTNEKPDIEKIKELAKLERETAELPSSKVYQDLNSAKSFTEAAKIFASDPVQIIAEATVESMVALGQHGASRIAVGAAMGSVVPGGTAGGAIAGMAETSMALEFASDFIETLKEAGVDTKDPVALQQAFQNDELISNTRAHALKKGTIIGLFDLVSGGLAGKIVAKPAKSLIGKAAQGGAELLVQGGLGATGEAVSQKAGGDELRPGEILIEGLAEFASAPIEVTIGATTFNKQSPTETVKEVTKNVIPTNEANLNAKAELIQQKVEEQEENIVAGKQEEKPITPTVDDQAAPITSTERTQEEGAVSETQAEKDVTEAAPTEAEGGVIDQPSTLLIENDENIEQPVSQPTPDEAVPTVSEEEQVESNIEDQAAQEVGQKVTERPGGGDVERTARVNKAIDDLVESGDLQREADNKVTVLTEKGGQELKRIFEENKVKTKVSDAVQEQGPDAVDVGEQTGDGGAVAEGDAIEQEPAVESQEKTSQGEAKQVTTPKDVHVAAKEAGIDYESKEFMKASKDITGKAHLDDMAPSELDQMVNYINATTPPTTNTGSVALDQPEEQKLSGIKKALVPEGKVETTPIEKRSTEEILTSAKENVDRGSVNPKAIVDEIALGNARALQPDEVGALVYYKAQLDNKSNQLNADLLKAIDSKDLQAQASLRPQIDAINQEIDRYHTMALKTAYEQSLAFNLRKMLLDNEYNLQSQINKYKVANGGKITPEVEQKFKDLDKRLQAANAKIRQLEEQGSTAAATEAMKTIRQDLQEQRERRKKAAQQRKEKINDFFNSLKIKADPNKLNSITQVIGEAVFNGSLEVIKKAILAGADVATAIQAGIDYVNEHYRGNDFDEKLYRSIIQPGLEKLIPSEKGIVKPEVRNGKLYIPASIIKALVEGGAKDINELVDQVHAIVKESLPDISKREVRDAITRYGETRNLSQDEINKQIREIKRVGRLISALEDVQNKMRPLRSGLQRDKLTDQERRLQREIKEAMKDLPVDQSELDKAWRTALDAVKSRLNNQIADLENQIKTGEKTPKKKGIAYDEEATELKERRDKLRAIIQSIEGKPKMSDEQRVRMAVSNVQRTIAELEERIKNKDTSKKEQGKTPETPELKALREQRDKLRADYAQMESDLGVAEQKRLDNYKKTLKRSAERYEERLRTKDFATKKKQPIPLDEEATKLKLERDKIKQQFDIEQEKARLANRPWNEKIWDTFIDLWNIPKSLLASIDMSAPFRQGAILSISNPKAGGRAFQEMFSQAFSEKKANEWLLKLRESPFYAVIKQSKLYVAEPNTKLTAKEENFMSNFASRIPVIGPMVKASERAYVGYLNKLRVDIFANGADRLREQGITPENNPEAYKSLANFINNATGRGNLGALELAAPVLNGLFFSPRYIMSRFNLLNPVTYAKMPAPVRKMALKSVLSYVGFTVLFIGLLDAAFDDLDIEWDPRSTDFGKLRIGKTRIDPWAGFQQVVRLLAQLATGQKKNTKTGAITNLDGRKFPFETRADVALRFGRSKLSPTASTVANVLSGKTIVGEEVTVGGELLKNVTPLYMQDLKEIYDEEGPTGVVLSAIPAFFGFGVQSYGGKSGLKNKEFDPKSEIQTTNQKNEYSFSNPGKGDLSASFGQDIDNDTYDEFYKLRDKEIARLYRNNKWKLENSKDADIYDRMMDNITKEAGRSAKYQIARKNKWDTSSFAEGNVFYLKTYKKDKEGKVVEK